MRYERYLGLISLLLSACGGAEEAADEGNLTPVEQGLRVYMDPRPDGNSFRCATCHALTDRPDGLRRPGHPIGDAPRRPSFKNGQLNTFVDAANSCLEEWMSAESLWTEDSSDYQALVAFLDDQAGGATESAPAITFSILAPPTDLSGGDAGRGQTLFNSSCAVCHGDNASGTQQGPQLAGRNLDPELIARRVRTSGQRDSRVYDNLTGGRMPFWSLERLSDEELLDLVEYVRVSEADDPGPGPDNNGNPGPGGESCASTHPKVGQRAELQEIFHDVGGTAIIEDDCTIAIENFQFDGGGINVRIYGGLNGNYDDGFALEGPNLVRAQPYEGERIEVKLPEGTTLDDLDGVSVWCVPVQSDFGSGLFLP